MYIKQAIGASSVNACPSFQPLYRLSGGTAARTLQHHGAHHCLEVMAWHQPGYCLMQASPAPVEENPAQAAAPLPPTVSSAAQPKEQPGIIPKGMHPASAPLSLLSLLTQGRMHVVLAQTSLRCNSHTCVPELSLRCIPCKKRLGLGHIRQNLSQ